MLDAIDQGKDPGSVVAYLIGGAVGGWGGGGIGKMMGAGPWSRGAISIFAGDLLNVFWGQLRSDMNLAGIGNPIGAEAATMSC